MCQTCLNMTESPFELKVTHTCSVPWRCDLKAGHGSIWGLVTGRGMGLGLNGSPVAEGQWCSPEEVHASVRKCQVQLLPLVVCAFHQ